jgi:hypothetical protein
MADNIDVAALWRQYKETEAAAQTWCNAHPDLEFHKAPSYQRHIAAEEAIIAARPDDLLDMAAQLEWAANAIDDGGQGDEPAILRAIAQNLEAAAAPPLTVITDGMVMVGLEAERAHRHAGAEERVRAILAAALPAQRAEPRSTVSDPMWEAWKATELARDAALAAEEVAQEQYGCASAEAQQAEAELEQACAAQGIADARLGLAEPRTLAEAVGQARFLAHWIGTEGSLAAVPALSLTRCLEDLAGVARDPLVEEPLACGDIVAERVAEKRDEWRALLRRAAP